MQEIEKALQLLSGDLSYDNVAKAKKLLAEFISNEPTNKIRLLNAIQEEFARCNGINRFELWVAIRTLAKEEIKANNI